MPGKRADALHCQRETCKFLMEEGAGWNDHFLASLLRDF